MKTPRLHRSHRPLAHSAGSALIVLAALLTTAAPVAADAEPRAGEEASQASQCRKIHIQRGRGLEGTVWTVLSGTGSTTTVDSQCTGSIDSSAGAKGAESAQAE
ncbi:MULTISPECIES: hypothetical protein [unclassified Streptomyces]|uniref:hypothetical protein n=1 Tax=unclassified Streptomyces TaxID=2593676 RepID=UPI00068DFF8E|nr:MULTISPECIES: hypothetical protein [unclassified Streptomyces]